MDLTTTVARARSYALGDVPRRSAARTPEAVALRYRERTYRYRELDDVINRTANALAAEGVRRGDRIALFSRNNDAYVALVFALARLGAIAVPVNFMLNGAELGFILGHSRATGIVAEDELVPVAEAALADGDLGGRVRLRAVIVDTGARPAAAAAAWVDVVTWLGHDDTTAPAVDVADDDPIQLMYTSGTESRPKGVIITSRMLMAQYASCMVDGRMSADDVEVHSLPLYHCAQLHVFLVPGLALGATNVLLRTPEPGALLDAVAEHRATKLFCPPTVWISLLRHPRFDTTDLSTLRKGYYGASIMPVEVLGELGCRLPDMGLFNLYGQTEMAPVATVLLPEEQVRKAGSAGRPALNVETRVVDDDERPLPPGEVGEIVHRSVQATLGYWDDPDATARAYRGGWFHSGDLGVFDDEGYLTVVDRKKDMIKSGGENVASREVEEAIYGLDAVAEVAVIGLPHPRWIEAVTAVVVAKPGASLHPESVTEHCRRALAPYKAPKYVVVAEALPKNASGKVLKRELRERHAHLAESP